MFNELLLIGNVICAIGTLLLIRSVSKDRKILQGYDFLGSSLTFTALTLFNIWYVFANQWLTFIFGSITLIYWAVVVIFKIKYR
jgi:hypothetical protein